MNFLAHFFLSAPDEDLITGGFLGDFVKGPLNGQLPSGLERGVKLHRYIDSYTDKHAAQQHIKQRLPSHFARYSGIVADMMCDYALAKHWQRFTEIPIQTFNVECISLLNKNKKSLSPRAMQVLTRMDQMNWLLNYGDLTYIAETIAHIGKRMRFDNPLHECRDFLPAIGEQFESDCLKVLSDTQRAVTAWRKTN